MAAGLEAAAAAAAAPGRPMGFPAKISPAKGEYLKLKIVNLKPIFDTVYQI